MKNARGFTLIELIIVITIIALLATAAMTGINAFRGKSDLPSPPEAHSEISKCMEGYRVLRQPDGSYTQVLSESGTGIRCDK